MRIRWTLLVTLMLLGPPARANLTSVDIVPPNPTVDDSVVVHVRGYLFDSCWSAPLPPECDVFPQNQLFMGIESYERGGVCLPLIVNYEKWCNFGKLTAGTYTLLVVETPISSYSNPPDSSWVTFPVQDPTPVRSISWGTLKSRY